MQYYPIYLNITGRKCIVVGGGNVAERKVKRLVECGACVTVIGRSLTDGLERMKKALDIEHIDDDYAASCLNDAFLVIGATDCDDVNAKISADAKKMGIMVNMVDDPERCDFILPSTIERGELSIAISTGGKSPALAKKIRKEMEALYGPEYLLLLKILGNLRQKIKSRNRSQEANKRLFETVVNSDILQHIREKKWNQIKRMLHDMTGEDIEIEE